MVQVHHDEGVANRIDPESCADAREGIGEALTGERIGQPLSRESTLILGADVVPVTEGNTDGRDNASAQTARRGLRHWHVRTLFAREPGDLMVGQRQHACCTGPRRDYEQHLERNLEDLHARVHRGAYRALPSRRVYIPKPDGRQRPIAVAALEDKIVQRATAAVLSAIYEEDFLGFSYGFRPGRSTHDAMDALMVGITSTKVNWILDADIRSFFDTVSQEWLIKFVEHRVGDRRIIRLIQKWLKAGVLEDGLVTVSDKGTGQGSVISPLLANLYLHYAFDLWAERWRRREAAGNMIIVRYADDLIVGFEHETDARRFLDEMRKRLQEFALSLHSEKTRLIEFGRFAVANRKRRGLGKPETFTFLGFTFICGKTRRGKFQIKRKSRRDRMQAKLQAIKQELRRSIHQPIPQQGRWLQQVVTGSSTTTRCRQTVRH